MTDINVKKLTDSDLDELKRDIEREIQRRANGPTRVVYVVTEWGEHRAFADFRCAAICFSDIAGLKKATCSIAIKIFPTLRMVGTPAHHQIAMSQPLRYRLG